MKGDGTCPNPMPAHPESSPLTSRECDVLELICEDFSNREIADALRISESTVKRHVENMLRKTGCAGRAGLVAYVIVHDWFTPVSAHRISRISNSS